MIGQEQEGPFSEGQVRQMHKAERITSETLYWKEGMPEWRTVMDLLPPVARPVSQKAAIVPERRAVTGAGDRSFRQPAQPRAPLWPRISDRLAEFSPVKNPNVAKGLVIVLGFAFALLMMYELSTSTFVATRLLAPPPPPPDATAPPTANP